MNRHAMRNQKKHHPVAQLPTPGFAIRLTDQTDLGIAMLIIEDDDGGYLPLAPVSSIAEAREMAQHDLLVRMLSVEEGEVPMCPAAYKVWAQGLDGYTVAAEFCPCNL